MNRFAKRYEGEEQYSEYDVARKAMGNRVKPVPSHSYSYRSVGNTDKFEAEYQAFISKLKAQKEEKAAEETPVIEETPVVEEVKPTKKRKSKTVVEETVVPTVEKTVASDDTLFG